MSNVPPSLSGDHNGEQMALVLAELRQIRVGIEHLNKRVAGSGGGVEIKVFWKIAWGIIMAQLLILALVTLFWLVFAVLIGGAMAAAGTASGP